MYNIVIFYCNDNILMKSVPVFKMHCNSQKYAIVAKFVDTRMWCYTICLMELRGLNLFQHDKLPVPKANFMKKNFVQLNVEDL